MTSADANEGLSFSPVVERTCSTLGKIETEGQVIDGYDSENRHSDELRDELPSSSRGQQP